MTDEPDNPSIRVPPPPVYLLALLLGLLASDDSTAMLALDR